MHAAAASRTIVFVGTYTKADDEGIFIYELDDEGALQPITVGTDVINPSFLVISPDQKYLYSVSEVSKIDGKPGGGVASFSIEPGTFKLTKLSEQSSHGRGPCHVAIDATGKTLMVANYGSGSVASYPVKDGVIGEAASTYQHEGKSANQSRQEGPHAHSINVDPGNNYAFVADLGTDEVLAFKLDANAGTITRNVPFATKVTPGAGPRHFDFAPDGKHGYLINELDNTMIAFAYDAVAGTLEELQTLSTLPEGFADTSYCADVHVSKDGRFVYGSNRGHDSIVVFARDAVSGKLTFVDTTSTQGDFPRGFNLDPTGGFLLAGNQNTDNIFTYRVDWHTGKLTATGHETKVVKPVCIKCISV